MTTRALAGAFGLALLAGCSHPSAPPPAPSPPTLPASPPGAATAPTPARRTKPPAPVSATAVPVEVETLTVDPSAPAEVRLKAPDRSLAAVERYDAALKQAGWKARPARSAEEPGQRKWVSYPVLVPGSPSAGYEAVWEEPGTGRVADLRVWEVRGETEIQYASFALFRSWQALQAAQR